MNRLIATILLVMIILVGLVGSQIIGNQVREPNDYEIKEIDKCAGPEYYEGIYLICENGYEKVNITIDKNTGLEVKGYEDLEVLRQEIYNLNERIKVLESRR